MDPKARCFGPTQGQVWRALCSAAVMALMVMPVSRAEVRNKSDFCNEIGKVFQASSGVQMYCFGPQRNGAANPAVVNPLNLQGTANVDAANQAEDRTGSGAYVGGQSETSIAAAGNYVVEAWNDGTGFFAECGSPMYKEELTGYSFSADGGKTFTDYGGLPNNDCFNSRWQGDPSVGVYRNSGFTYFYISSLFSNPSGLTVAVSACQVTGNTLACGQPTIVATSSCGGCGFSALDKDFLAVDRARKRLYITFTDFVAPGAGQIEMAACDIANPLAPVCSNGSSFGQPYVTVQPGDTVNFCEYEGAYPAVDRVSGDVYVGYEYNWATNVFSFGSCVTSISTQVVVTRVPARCLPIPESGSSPCSPPFRSNSNIIVSTDATFVPGYNRFMMNDFPRIAVSHSHGTVTLVWNDARRRPLGDIFMQSYTLGGLVPVQFSPVRLNGDTGPGDMHTMPALKNGSPTGLLNVTWYDRRGANAGTGKTDVFGVINVSPLTTTTPTNHRFTNVTTDWLATSSVIVPNFGDYTDNWVSNSGVLYVTWSDGRTGVPQPEVAHVAVQ